jgi:hypothetical protein
MALGDQSGHRARPASCIENPRARQAWEMAQMTL